MDAVKKLEMLSRCANVHHGVNGTSNICHDEAQRLHPGKISFRFSTPVVAVNLDTHTVRLASDSDHNDVKEVMNQYYSS